MGFKDIYDIIKGGFSLEIKSDEGKLNNKVVGLVTLITVAYLYFQTQIEVANIQYMHRSYGILSLKICFIPIIIGSLLCFILMCLTYISRSKIDESIKNN